MIGKYVEFFITCDECSTSNDYHKSEWSDEECSCIDGSDYPLQAFDKLIDLKRAAKEEGWIIKKGKKCCCPKCANKLGLAKKT